ncbi:hypothetical protein JK2ML_2562 [Mycobacterium leprae Kyoto-2]|uniref:Uncharacterized protein n=3 Tax=Mycobacterium leprae TaxID=1769 RepID=Q9CD23_MYCLE|nr:hypothetical protein [Mycobacterium leprae]CAR72661.1 hypothetical protein MLBr02562 [Mycobacterium leprae Br4923]AWV48780.1 hypothetical protein DIJ64_14095 [Mycobacterium leprae]OAR21074.1 hypothetical protein A8144_07890 [Mycobacterium leprae 3125609]OAX71243.1 hypothetical protein A3216_07010 [Mycobacterium leprae 7935681]CAC32093.1 hypothetical protein [Mycobacterium leprae]
MGFSSTAAAVLGAAEPCAPEGHRIEGKRHALPWPADRIQRQQQACQLSILEQAALQWTTVATGAAVGIGQLASGPAERADPCRPKIWAQVGMGSYW